MAQTAYRKGSGGGAASQPAHIRTAHVEGIDQSVLCDCGCGDVADRLLQHSLIQQHHPQRLRRSQPGEQCIHVSAT